MARFHFNLHGDEEVADREGCELPGLAAVKKRAIHEARSLLSADVLDGEFSLGRFFLVTDDLGEIVLIMPFSEALALPRNASS